MEVADFLIKAGADIELGCSTPLMEAAQEGHLELVKYLLAAGEQERWMQEAADLRRQRTYLAEIRNFVTSLCQQSLSFFFLCQGQTFMPPRQQVTQR